METNIHSHPKRKTSNFDIMNVKYILYSLITILLGACSLQSDPSISDVKDAISSDGVYCIPNWSKRKMTLSGHLDPYGRFYPDKNCLKYVNVIIVDPIDSDYLCDMLGLSNLRKIIQFNTPKGLAKDDFYWLDGFRSEKYYQFLENYRHPKKNFYYSFQLDESLDETRYIHITCEVVACSYIPKWPSKGENGFVCINILSLEKPDDDFIERQIYCYKNQCKWLASNKERYSFPERTSNILKLNGTNTSNDDQGRPFWGDAQNYPVFLVKIVEQENGTARKRFFNKMKEYGLEQPDWTSNEMKDYMSKVTIPVQALEEKDPVRIWGDSHTSWEDQTLSDYDKRTP